ncbi:MAG: PAS domain-containing protein [Candidatus Marinimicrobia bacterium]|nr:PAS domain-containing protein [Candidatus Neomarinimicrobiota bacterium]
MLLVNRNRLYFFYILVCGIITALAINSYWVFHKFNLSANPDLKYHSENFIYFVILSMLIFLFIFIHIIYRSKDIYKELDKTIDLVKQGTPLTEDHLKKIDVLGQKIFAINSTLNILNEKKTLKITSQSYLVDFLIGYIHQNMLITDIQGRILKVTNSLLHKYNVEEKEIVDRFIHSFVQNLNFFVVVADLRGSKNTSFEASVKFNKDENFVICYLSFYPVYNQKNELTNCICFIMDETEFLASIKEQSNGQ